MPALAPTSGTRTANDRPLLLTKSKVGPRRRLCRNLRPVCGIVGVWEFTASDDLARETRVQAAMSRLRHRGPDSSGVWSSPSSALSLGHQRLAVIDLSSTGHQPMRSHDGRYVISFNGEIYNHKEVRADLEAQGLRLRSSSDTEVLLEGFARWGNAVLDKLVGQFAFAIWDEAEKRLFLARDRLGEKPLYYARTPHAFAFASELAAISELPGVDTTLDPAAVQLFLEHQYVPAPLTIFKGVRKLLPAHSLTVDRTGERTACYWDVVSLGALPERELSEQEALEELETRLRVSVGQQMAADVPLGAFLSGGIDSTSVVAMMSELSERQVETFTIGFDVPGYNEASHAAAVAEFLGTKHTCEYLRLADALDLVPKLPTIYGEPFADYSALPTHLVSQIARQHVTVSLSGDGGDELFGGYERYSQFERLASAQRLLGPLPNWFAPPMRRLPGRLGRLAGHVVGGRLRDPYRPLVSAFNAIEVRELTGTSEPARYAQFDRAWSGTVGLPPRRRAMVTDLVTYLPEAILVKVDRAAMATSLEVRAPFLDHRLVEWSLTLPARLKHEKQLLRHHVFKKVPRALLDRPKQGFGVPVSDWFRSELQDLLRDELTPQNLDRFGITNAATVRTLIDDHMAGRRENGAKLWTLLVLALWGEAHLERPSS